MTLSEQVKSRLSVMTQDEYFKMSEDRKVITPENIGGLIEYPALFKAMQDDREMRPALSDAMSTGRAMNDFLSMTPEEFLKIYVVADGPINPKTGKPYGTETKAYVEWVAMQDRKPIGTAQYDMFGKMATAYNEHAFIRELSGYERLRNVVIRLAIEGVDVACKIDSLYIGEKDIFAVDVTTTEDLLTFSRTVDRLHYREKQALISLLVNAVSEAPCNVSIAAIEKGKLPRCGVFGVNKLDSAKEYVVATLIEYAESMKSGHFGTRFEGPLFV